MFDTHPDKSWVVELSRWEEISSASFSLEEENEQVALAKFVVENMENQFQYVLGLPERKLLVDTGDIRLEEELVGYWRILVGYREFAVVRVK